VLVELTHVHRGVLVEFTHVAGVEADRGVIHISCFSGSRVLVFATRYSYRCVSTERWYSYHCVSTERWYSYTVSALKGGTVIPCQH
jgi:hypothetical protein